MNENRGSYYDKSMQCICRTFHKLTARVHTHSRVIAIVTYCLLALLCVKLVGEGIVLNTTPALFHGLLEIIHHWLAGCIQGNDTAAITFPYQIGLQLIADAVRLNIHFECECDEEILQA